MPEFTLFFVLALCAGCAVSERRQNGTHRQRVITDN